AAAGPPTISTLLPPTSAPVPIPVPTPGGPFLPGGPPGPPPVPSPSARPPREPPACASARTGLRSVGQPAAGLRPPGIGLGPTPRGPRRWTRQRHRPAADRGRRGGAG